ncbi:MAG: hypothetical protein NC826_06010 [Candidatus Omnitrophica bacterium]|nr:hypothetical protein [Candidatus Omnitrophota bacterium]
MGTDKIQNKRIKELLLKGIFTMCITISVFFFLKTLIVRQYIPQYYKLIGKSLEKRREIVYKKNLYYFLNFCLKNLPPFSTYRLVGLDKETTDYARAYYYLYPHINTIGPEFILMYKTKNYSEDNYSLWRKVDEDNFILKKNVLHN